MNKEEYQALLAKSIIQMIRDYQDNGDILEHLEDFTVAIGMIINNDRVVNWLDIAGICDQRYYSLKYGKNGPTDLNTKLLNTCEKKVQLFLYKASSGTAGSILPDSTKIMKIDQKCKDIYQAGYARNVIDMIRNYQDDSDVLKYLESIAFCTAAILNDNRIVNWLDIAGVCDQRSYSLKYGKNGPTELNERLLGSCEKQVQKHLSKEAQE